MESVLFLLEVIAFLLVVAWTCLVESTGNPARGLLGMTPEDDSAVPVPLPEADWKRVPKRVAVQRVSVQGPKPPRAVGPTPSWRRPMRFDRQR